MLIKYHMKAGILYLYLFLGLSIMASCQRKPDPPPDPITEKKEVKYVDYVFSGFTVKIKDTYINTPDAKTALTLIESDLKEIVELIPLSALELMRLKPIWLEKDIQKDGAAWYHPNREWLIQNAMNPEKAKCVEINNYVNYVSWVKMNQPFMVLHELAHLYHDQKLSFDNAEILAAYNNAVENKLYYKVERHDGSGKYSVVDKAYALTNHHEYFAELSEAYFGLNDFFPYTREELIEYDPKGYEVIHQIWNIQ